MKVRVILDRFANEHADLKAQIVNTPVALPDDVEWVKKRIAGNVKVDQHMRLFIGDAQVVALKADELKCFWEYFGDTFRHVDELNTLELKFLLARYEWFTISRFGPEADSQAWLMVQHADNDRPFQKEVLGRLEKLVSRKETSPQNFAYLYDRVAVGENRSQRYGTQGFCKSAGVWEPNMIDAPEAVDRRRADVGLEPLDNYQKKVSKFCY